MAKERYLTIMVPIKDSDCEATVYANLAALQSAVPASSSNVNKIYKVSDGTYYRSTFNTLTTAFSYVAVTDREFPYLGDPMDLYDFTYDATRMGSAPTISAQAVMRYAEKDGSGQDITLEELWEEDCHVWFNGTKFYLKRIPNSGKNNQDARYKYDVEFVDERVVLENTYFYDVVSPFVTEKPISESATFSFYGDINELAKRLNASLIRTGLSKLTRKYVGYPSNPSVMVQYLSYEQWNRVAVDLLSLVTDRTFINQGQALEFHNSIYDALEGDYNAYLMEYIYENDGQGNFNTTGYKVVVGKDKKGETTSSEEKLLSFDKAYVHEALQTFHDTFELDYYVAREKDGNGEYTGNTLIVVGDCEHDFADWDSSIDDYVRDENGIPTTTSPFDYGVVNELLSKEKNATNDKIVTRVTGVGSSDNLPWHYPNPTPDGWIKPLYFKDGVLQNDIVVGYPTSPGTSPQEMNRYEKYLKNRIGNVFKYGIENNVFFENNYVYITPLRRHILYSPYYFSVRYEFTTSGSNSEKMTLELSQFLSESNFAKFEAVFSEEGNAGSFQTISTYRSDQTYTDPDGFQKMCASRNGKDTVSLLSNNKYRILFTFTMTEYPPNSKIYDFSGYYYPYTMVIPRLPSDYTDPQTGWHHEFHGFAAYIEDNFYPSLGLQPCVDWFEDVIYNPTTAVAKHYIVPRDGGRSSDGTYANKVSPNPSRHQGKNFLDIASGNIYKCSTQGHAPVYDQSGVYENLQAYYTPALMNSDEWVKTYMNLRIREYTVDGWYFGNKKINLEDYGLDEPTLVGESYTPEIFDSIDFQMVTWVTPQATLMPEVYIKTDGERRFYNAHNYYPLKAGTADTAIGEEQEGTDVINPLYKENETDTDDKHYKFENEYNANRPHEHIEVFDDIKPTIKGQKNIVDGVELRIDVAEMYGYDWTDNDEVWVTNDDGNYTGEFKHPYFFAKLRPMGFNIFNLALVDDMVISMTTGQCGACNFRIGVDEKTKKNPVQVWDFDVYAGPSLAQHGDKIYSQYDLRRYVDLTGLYYDTDGTESGYVSVAEYLGYVGGGDVVTDSVYADRMYKRYTYTKSQVADGFVGSTNTKKNGGNLRFEGDVVTNGKFQAIQQDTTEEYVWVALMKDTETYGTLMPSARVDYTDPNYNSYIRPKSIADVHEDGSTMEEDEENADKFVITNIALPQVYLRRAERELSKAAIKYMYENNWQKYNFSINFSRIFLDENASVNDALNENSVLYVNFNRRVFRQYAKHYTYKMSKGAALPEITVETNQELPVTMNIFQRQEKEAKKTSNAVSSNFNAVNNKIREVSRGGDTYVTEGGGGGSSTVITHKLQWGEF